MTYLHDDICWWAVTFSVQSEHNEFFFFVSQWRQWLKALSTCTTEKTEHMNINQLSFRPASSWNLQLGCEHIVWLRRTALNRNLPQPVHVKKTFIRRHSIANCLDIYIPVYVFEKTIIREKHEKKIASSQNRLSIRPAHTRLLISLNQQSESSMWLFTSGWLSTLACLRWNHAEPQPAYQQTFWFDPFNCKLSRNI